MNLLVCMSQNVFYSVPFFCPLSAPLSQSINRSINQSNQSGSPFVRPSIYASSCVYMYTLRCLSPSFSLSILVVSGFSTVLGHWNIAPVSQSALNFTAPNLTNPTRGIQLPERKPACASALSWIYVRKDMFDSLR